MKVLGTFFKNIPRKKLSGQSIILSAGFVADQIEDPMLSLSQSSHLEIRDCPGKVRTSPDWQFRSTFQEGFLRCQSGELLANAKVTKKFIKDMGYESL